MKTTKILAATLVTLSALTGVVTTSNAADPAASVKSLDTTAKVTLEAGETVAGGDLAIIQAPTFDFGKHKVSETTATNTPNSDTEFPSEVVGGAPEKGPNNILKVQDTRGTNAGWTVTATVTKPFTTANPETTDPETTDPATAENSLVEGAVIHLGTTTETNDVTGTDLGSDGKELDAGFDASASSTVVASAAATFGGGFSRIQYTDATLTIPSGSLVGAYTAEINWTLANTVTA